MKNNRPPRREMLSLAGPQIKIICLVAVPLIVTCLALTALQTYFFLTTLYRDASLNVAMKREVYTLALLIMLVTLLVIVPLSALMAVLISHRIVGPLRRLARDLEGVGEGRLAGHFILREGDELAFLATAATHMKQSLRERVEGVVAAQTKLEEATSRLRAESKLETTDLEALQQALADLRGRTAGFTLVAPPPVAPAAPGEPAAPAQ